MLICPDAFEGNFSSCPVEVVSDVSGGRDAKMKGAGSLMAGTPKPGPNSVYCPFTLAPEKVLPAIGWDTARYGRNAPKQDRQFVPERNGHDGKGRRLADRGRGCLDGSFPPGFHGSFHGIMSFTQTGSDAKISHESPLAGMADPGGIRVE